MLTCTNSFKVGMCYWNTCFSIINFVSRIKVLHCKLQIPVLYQVMPDMVDASHVLYVSAICFRRSLPTPVMRILAGWVGNTILNGVGVQ